VLTFKSAGSPCAEVHSCVRDDREFSRSCGVGDVWHETRGRTIQAPDKKWDPRIMVEKRYSATMIEFQLPIPDFRVHKRSQQRFSRPSESVHRMFRKSPFVSESYLYLPVKKLSVIKSLSRI